MLMELSAVLFLHPCALVWFQVQSFSNDEHSPEPVDLLRFSPLRTNRYSVPFAPPSYSSISTRKSSKTVLLVTLSDQEC